ncbi:L-asparagine transporter-like permease [Peribacillus simplex]
MPTQKSINPYAGFLVGWSILMDFIHSNGQLFVCSAVLFSSFPSVPAYVRALNLLIIATIIDVVEDIKYKKVNAPLSNEK